MKKVLIATTAILLSTSAFAKSELTWEKLVKDGERYSAQQFEGKPVYDKACFDEGTDKASCSTRLQYVNEKGVMLNLLEISVPNGQIYQRQICWLNEDAKTRVCVDWDRNTSSLEHVDEKAKVWVTDRKFDLSNRKDAAASSAAIDSMKPYWEQTTRNLRHTPSAMGNIEVTKPTETKPADPAPTTTENKNPFEYTPKSIVVK